MGNGDPAVLSPFAAWPAEKRAFEGGMRIAIHDGMMRATPGLASTMAWTTGLILGLATTFLISTASAQAPTGGSSGSSSDSATSGGGKGNNPPGTPSWGSERMPTRKNPSSPTAPCPAGTTRQNLGQDCHPLDKDEKSKSKK